MASAAALHTPAERRLRVVRAYLEGYRNLAAVAVAEGHVEVVETAARMEELKADLVAALEDQRAELARDLVAGRRGGLRADAPEVLAPLDALRELGRESARDECRSMGVEPTSATRFAATLDPTHFVEFRGRLDRVEGRMRNKLDALPFDVAEEVAVRRLESVPGLRDAASRITSPAYTSGLADVYADNEDAFGGWQYTGVFDRATCSNCGPLDGTTYETLEEMYRVLPNFGPNPSCSGGTRCRCRGVPLPPSADRRARTPAGATPEERFRAQFRADAADLRAQLAEEYRMVESERLTRQLGQRVEDEIERRMVGRVPASPKGSTLKEAKAEYEAQYRRLEDRSRELKELRTLRVGEPPDFVDDAEGAATWWREARQELADDADYLAIKADVDERWASYQEVRKAGRSKAVPSATTVRNEVVDEVLREVRDFGGEEFTIVGGTPRIQAEAARFPTDWRARADYVGIDVMDRGERAFYSRGDRMIGVQKQESASVILHELGHHMEYSVPRLSTVTKQFLTRRYNGREIRPLGGQYGVDERGVPDEFNDRYIGKWYKSKATEVLAMGLEGVFHGKHKFWTGRDSEWRQLILGMLVGL